MYRTVKAVVRTATRVNILGMEARHVKRTERWRSPLHMCCPRWKREMWGYQDTLMLQMQLSPEARSSDLISKRRTTASVSKLVLTPKLAPRTTLLLLSRRNARRACCPCLQDRPCV